MPQTDPIGSLSGTMNNIVSLGATKIPRESFSGRFGWVRLRTLADAPTWLGAIIAAARARTRNAGDLAISPCGAARRAYLRPR